MWIFTNRGFISAVQHRDDKDLLMVRARRLDHLKALFPGIEIIEMQSADYRYRVTVKRDVFSAVVLREIEQQLTYDNFKNSIADHSYHDACSSVWSVMMRLQPGRSYPQDLTDDLFEEVPYRPPSDDYPDFPFGDESKYDDNDRLPGGLE